jgi:hypothetical protein
MKESQLRAKLGDDFLAKKKSPKLSATNELVIRYTK